MNATNQINPRVRAYGKARIAITRQARDEAEWLQLWKAPAQPYPFRHAEGWKLSIEYTVDDYAAEIGFFIDVLGFPIWSFSPSRVELTNPGQDWLLIVSAAGEGEAATQPGSLRLNLHLAELDQAVKELERRGVSFDSTVEALESEKGERKASFRTPHGILFSLWEIPIGPTFTEVAPMQAVWSASGDDVEEEQWEMAEEEDEISQQLEEEKPSTAAGESQAHFWRRLADPVESREPGGQKPQASRPERASSQEKRSNGSDDLTYSDELTYTPIENGDDEIDDAENLDEYP